MECWLFNLIQWPFQQTEIPYPFPGAMFDRSRAKHLYDESLRLFKRADELGYDAICLPEHHYGSNGLIPSPNIMAAALATQTERAKIALMGNCLPIHGHPVRVAEELAMVDVLSGGRLISGFIRGGPREYFAYGVDVATGRSMFNEAWELIVKAWTAEEPFAWHGEYYHYDVVSILPRPLQQPHPPLMMAGNTAESVEWAAQHHVPLMTNFSPVDQMAETFAYYRKYAQEHCGWSPEPKDMGECPLVYVAETDAKARQEAGPQAETFFSVIGKAHATSAQLQRIAAGARTERSFAYKTTPHAPRPQRFDFDTLAAQGYCIVGSPDTVVRAIKQHQKLLSIGIIMTHLPFGMLEPGDAMNSLELFAKEVMPHLRNGEG